MYLSKSHTADWDISNSMEHSFPCEADSGSFKKTLPLSMEPEISPFFFKSWHMTADYLRKINLVTSGFFATGFRKSPTHEILDKADLEMSYLILMQTIKVPPPLSKRKNLHNRIFWWAVSSLRVGHSYFALCACDTSPNGRHVGSQPC